MSSTTAMYIALTMAIMMPYYMWGVMEMLDRRKAARQERERERIAKVLREVGRAEFASGGLFTDVDPTAMANSERLFDLPE